MADAHKAIAKAIKAKGLQKLKYWCELCHKQCRDANGYKNHCTTDGHLRQVSLFSQNATSFIDEYSKAFEKAFMELVRRRWRFKDILAKKAYNEYIQDKEHVHMNATQWVTLSDFAHHLGKAGLCEVKDTEEGLAIRYIDRDPQREAKQAAIRDRERQELEHREIERKRLLKQVKAMETDHSTNPENSAIAPSSSDSAPIIPSGPISFSFNAPKPSSQAPPSAPISISLSNSPEPLSMPVLPLKSASPHNDSERSKKRGREEGVEAKEEEPIPKRSKLATGDTSTSTVVPASSSNQSVPKNPNSAGSSLDSIMEAQERRREIEGRKDYWLHPNIIVKILNKEVGHGQFYKQKGTVIEVEEKYLAKIKLENGTILKVDQEDLETVLPALYSHILIVNGAYRGETAVLQSINQEKFNTSVKILAGPARGRLLTKAYEDICKLVS